MAMSDSTPASVLALDLGGTQIRAACVLPDGSRIGRVARPTPVEDGADAMIAACIDALRGARDEAAAGGAPQPAAIGISAPGPLDPWAGVIHDAPNLGPAFDGVPLAARVEAALGLPTFLERDTNVAALAEHAFGAARGIDDFLYFTVSTGVGGAIVSEGRIVHGPDGMAGELGHIQVDLDGPRCGCGGIGHVEAMASGRAIGREARDAAEAGRSPFLAMRAAASGLDSLDAADVADGEDAGDLVCRDILSTARRVFAAACTSAVNAFNPTRIVVGGSVAQHQGDRLLQPARDAVAIGTFRAPGRRVRIVAAELGPDVSLAGAYPLVMSRLQMHSAPQEVSR